MYKGTGCIFYCGLYYTKAMPFYTKYAFSLFGIKNRPSGIKNIKRGFFFIYFDPESINCFIH